jgi:cellulose synthase/poly-beta-1,6-N-acetylglucosamine synthase-like glycosyltransferase
MIQIIFLVVSLIVTSLFFIYGYNCYYLLRSSRKYKFKEYPPYNDGSRPQVVVHLPIFNEKYVVHRLLESCTRMAENYSKEKVRIIILDDSDDDTVSKVDELVREYSKKGFRIEIKRRQNRLGFKAGALQIALENSDEEYVAIFDADFIPSPDFLTKTITYFMNDDKLGIIQCRWTHINRDYNFITKAVAIGIDTHFLIEQPGRYAANCFLNFNGSGGVIRRKAILEAGGWHSDTLAEDLDISYRMQLGGYKVLYLRDYGIEGEVPPSIPSFKKQQARWACGSLQTAKKLLPKILFDNRIGFKKRLEAFIHLTYYIVHPLMFISFLIAALASIFDIDVISVQGISQISSQIGSSGNILILIIENSLWITLGTAVVTCAVAAWIYFAMSLRLQGYSLSRNLPSLLILGMVGYGISISNTIEAFKGLLSSKSFPFKRTPKYNIRNQKDDWRNKRYQVPLDGVGILEGLMAIFGASSVIIAFMNSNFGILLILVFYTFAYSVISYLTITQSRRMI